MHPLLTKAAVAATAGLACGLLVSRFMLAETDDAEHAQRVLFDASSGEDPGWAVSTSQPDPRKEHPDPAAEHDWTGALSAWGVALHRTGGYSLRTLPPGTRITYGDDANALDLTHTSVLVLPGPREPFAASERSAILRWLADGGGLFLLADGPRAAAVLNTLAGDRLGLSFATGQAPAVDGGSDRPDSSERAGGTEDDPAGPVLRGPFGQVADATVRETGGGGRALAVRTAAGSSAEGLVFGPDGRPVFATGRYGKGRVAAWARLGDLADGTGPGGRGVPDGWGDPAGENDVLALNAIAWLAAPAADTG